MASQEIHCPDLGEFKDVAVVDVLVKAGDRVEPETGLVTLETDKATMDVPSPVAGVVSAVHVAKGDRVNTGSLLATVETEGAQPAAAETKSAPAAAQTKTAPAAAAPQPASQPEHDQESDERDQKDEEEPQSTRDERTPAEPIDEAAFAKAHASPSVRAFARELGADLGRIRGSGAKGRVTLEDVKSFVKSSLAEPAAPAGAAAAAPTSLPQVPRVDFTRFGAVERVPLGRIQRIAGPRLHASWVNIPHVTQIAEADITELEEARRWLKLRAAAEGIPLTSLAFVLRACVLALGRFPHFNASLDGDSLVLKKYVHIAFAADTPNGLVAPVIADADRKDVFALAASLAELSRKAREAKLSAAEIQGACFTVSNLGGIGGTAFTPIINAPEVAVLGLSRAAQKPVWQGGAFVPRLMLPLSLSYDHRVIDGADAARFCVFLSETLADVEGLLAAVS